MTLSRRDVLRGAGAWVALPFLESVRGFAQAAPQPPLRLGIVTVTGGTVIESWRLKESGPFGPKLPSILRPLDFARDELLLLDGLSHSGRGEGVNGHEHAAFLHLTGAPEVRKTGGKITAGVSVDQAAAAVVGDRTHLPSLEIGETNQETRYSFRTPEQPIPYEADPKVLFERMFRGRPMAAPNWKRRAGQPAVDSTRVGKSDSDDQAVVDLVLDEAQRLKPSLSVADRRRLDEYLHSIESVERRIRLIDALRKEAEADLKDPGPSRPVAPGELAGGQKARQAIGRDPEIHGAYLRVLSDLMVLGFQTDTTRVCTFAMGSDEAQFPGVVTVGYERHAHTLEHQGNADPVENADPIAREACRQIHAWYTQVFAEMVRRLQSIDEGGSTLLDHTMLLYTSYMADGGHGRDDYPVCLVGRAGGTLRTGRQVAFRKKTPAANLYVEMLDRMGVKADGFGDSKSSKHAVHDGRLPGLA